jgi:hypothetical protein
MRNVKRALFALLLLSAAPAFAATYYVDPNGNDSANGTSAAPWKTIQHAADTMRAGDTADIRAGTYAAFNITHGGTASARVIFHAESSVVINHPMSWGGAVFGINGSGMSYVTIEGFAVTASPSDQLWDYGIRLGGTPGAWVLGNIIRQNVVQLRVPTDATTNWDQLPIFTSWNDGLLIEDNTASGGWDSGIYVSNSARNYTVRGNEVFDVGGNGIHNNGDQSAGDPGINYNALIENNIIHHVGFQLGGQAISCDGVQDSTIRNNLIFDASAKGISLFAVDAAEGCERDVVENNPVVMDAGSYVAFRMNEYSNSNIIFNNIFLSATANQASVDVEENSTVGTFSTTT